MADLQGRKTFKVFNQDFIVDERYNVTKELGQGAYGIVWYVFLPLAARLLPLTAPSPLVESHNPLLTSDSSVPPRTFRPAKASPSRR